MTPADPLSAIDERLRSRLSDLADGLIPGVDGMPAPSSVDIGGGQLDAVMAARPDLVEGLRRALAAAGGVEDAIGWLEVLRGVDPSGHDALVTAVVGGYYLHPDVRLLLRYPGQMAQEVDVGGFPDYVDEGLLERVYERGPIYRPTPPG